MQRCHKMDELITLFEYEKEKTSDFDLIRIKDLIKNVSDLCSNISKLEIEVIFFFFLNFLKFLNVFS